MMSASSTKVSAIGIALLMTVAINGAMLWTFDNAAQEATVARATPPQIMVTLDTVTVVARRS